MRRLYLCIITTILHVAACTSFKVKYDTQDSAEAIEGNNDAGPETAVNRDTDSDAFQVKGQTDAARDERIERDADDLATDAKDANTIIEQDADELAADADIIIEQDADPDSDSAANDSEPTDAAQADVQTDDANDVADVDSNNKQDSCESQCSTGDRVCGPNGGTQICVEAEGCGTWEPEIPCSADSYCDHGKCVNCSTGYLNCDTSNPDCEILSDDDIANCGGCGLSCPPSSTCESGMCISQVGYPEIDCSGGLPLHNGYLFGFRISITRPSTLFSFGIVPNTNGSANFALYNEIGGRPGTLVAQTGDKTFVAYGGPLEFQVGSTELPSGGYWLMAVSHDTNRPQLCVDTSLDQIKLWQSNSVTGDPPNTYPDASDSTYVSYQHPWSMYITVRAPGE